MAWLGKVSLGSFPDLAGAVTKLSESVKNIEKNFDSALGLDEHSVSDQASGPGSSSSDRKALLEPVMALMGHKSGENFTGTSEETVSPQHLSLENEVDANLTHGPVTFFKHFPNSSKFEAQDAHSHATGWSSKEHQELGEEGLDLCPLLGGLEQVESPNEEIIISDQSLEEKACIEVGSDERQKPIELMPVHVLEHTENSELISAELLNNNLKENQSQHNAVMEHLEEQSPLKVTGAGVPRIDNVADSPEGNVRSEIPYPSSLIFMGENTIEQSSGELSSATILHNPTHKSISVDVDLPNKHISAVAQAIDLNADAVAHLLSGQTKAHGLIDYVTEVEKLKMEMEMMEVALQGAARQAQAKADEIARLMNENEQLKSVIEVSKKSAGESELNALREEYHEKVASLERKVYALSKERDTLRREQSRKNDATALLKEKDEIISQVMAEGEELSKKQAAQELQIRKLRAQIRELEEEKQRLNSRIQVEETKVESIRQDMAVTEKMLQETLEKSQAELLSQKEFYTSALNAAKEAETVAVARANNELRAELENRLRETGERETTLVQALDELRQTLTRAEQQAVFREDMFKRDIDDLQRRCQASELRCEELIAKFPESTRPLLRQIEAMQEATARKAEAWAAVENALNLRLQEAEAKAAVAEERERSITERLSQILSRNAVLEAQVSCLRAEHTQLSRSLEKERQRAAENRQENLAAQEAAATHESHVKQIDDEMRELKSKHKQELQKEISRRDFLEQELERERAARLDLESIAYHEASTQKIKRMNSHVENGNVPIQKFSSAGRHSTMGESYILQASLDSSDSVMPEWTVSSEATPITYFLKMTPGTFEATLRQKDGELASYLSRLASLESIRDSLAEELVMMTAEFEKFRAEAAALHGVRAELDALRRRHTAALELMGERDEELEELRADIVDLKEMYREQVDMLVNKIQKLSSLNAT